MTALPSQKAVTRAVTGAVTGGNAIRKNQEPGTASQNQNHQTITPSGALNFWLWFKDQLKTELSKEDWDLWLRPLLFLKELAGSKHLLLALPAVNCIMEAYKVREPWLRGKLGPLGYSCSATRYPDKYELDRACDTNPEWIEVRDRLLRKKEPQRAAG